jgi:Fe-S cluster assembly protein SufD
MKLQSAMQSLPGGPLSGARHEDWRYTNLEVAVDIGSRWLADGAKTAPGDGLAAPIQLLTASIDANWLIIANGIIDESGLWSIAGIEIEHVNRSNNDAHDRPLAKLGAQMPHDELRITLDAATEKPLALLIIDDAASNASVSQATIEIAVLAGCDVEIIEYQTSQGSGDHFANTAISLHIDQAATAHYVRIQNRGKHHVQTNHLSIDMSKDSALEMSSFDLGGRLVRNDVIIDIAATGVDANFSGLYLAGDRQHIDNHTRVDHRVGPATSSQEYRGILNGNCRAVWNGKAIVHEGADGTDANQENHNLLLSDKAEIDTKPELEIYAEDVKCSHGTTVGQLDRAALFYLRTRGLDQRHATQVLTRAFAADLVQRVPVAACEDAVAALVEARLSDLIKDETP